MKSFFERKFKYEGKKEWFNVFMGVAVGMFLVLILLYGFYNYTSSFLYSDTTVKETKSTINTIAYIANYLEKETTAEVTESTDDVGNIVGFDEGNRDEAVVEEPKETPKVKTDVKKDKKEAPVVDSKAIYRGVLQEMINRYFEADKNSLVRMSIGAVSMGAVDAELIAGSDLDGGTGRLSGGEISKNLSIDAQTTYREVAGEAVFKIVTTKSQDGDIYQTLLKGFRRYDGRFFDVALVTKADRWQFPFIPQFFLGIVTLFVFIVIAGFVTKFAPEKLRFLIGLAIFIVFSFLSLFLVYNFSRGDYQKNSDKLSAYYTMNIQIASASLEKIASLKLTTDDFTKIVESFNKDVYNDPSDGFIFNVADGTVKEDPVMMQTKISKDIGLITVGWLLGFLLGGFLFWRFSRKRGYEKFLNNIYNFVIAYLFVLPSILGMLILVFIPIMFTLIVSFTSLPATFKELNISRYLIGFENFAQILGVFDPFNPNNFYSTLIFTLLYTMAAVVIQATLGVVIAVILNQNKFYFKGFYQVVFMLPWIIPTYISGLLWNYFFTDVGVLNQIIQVSGGQTFQWLADPVWSFFIVSFVSAWYAFPFIMLVTISALGTISPSVFEAALIDGANWWQTLFLIVLPMIRPTVLPSLLLSSIWTFNNFNIVYLVVGNYGTPDILVTKIYDFARPTNLSYGYAAAYSALVFVVLLFLIYGFAKSTNITEKSF